MRRELILPLKRRIAQRNRAQSPSGPNTLIDASNASRLHNRDHP